MLIETLTIIGVGLIGGSVGLAARHRGLARRIVGVGRNRETLLQAERLGAIDTGTTELAEAIREATLVVVCTPVQSIADIVIEVSQYAPRSALITDAGSTKAVLIKEIERRSSPGIRFVGSHPLAGSAKQGPEHASARLFENRLTVVTPTQATNSECLAAVCEFWKALGSHVRIMTPSDHDAALGWTSHLPHLLAAALAGSLPVGLRDFAATGFRDTTRIAAGDPGLWAGIFRHNRDGVLAALDLFERELEQYRRALVECDEAALIDLLAKAKRGRDALGN